MFMRGLILFFLLTNVVFAGSCGLYVIKGIPEIKNKTVGIVIAKNSLSESFFPIDDFQTQNIVPYLNKTAIAQVVIREKDLVIIRIDEADFANPDPLRPEKDSFRKYVREVECPQ